MGNEFRNHLILHLISYGVLKLMNRVACGEINLELLEGRWS
jgi:hypothetical protein